MSTESLPSRAGSEPAATSTAVLLAAAANSSVRQADRERASTDRSGFVPPSLPDGVVFAHDAGEVAEILRLATAHRVPVVPRGAGDRKSVV